MVSIVADDPAFLDSISLIHSLDLQFKFYATHDDFSAGFDQNQAGCVLLDMRLPNIGPAIQARLNNLHSVRRSSFSPTFPKRRAPGAPFGEAFGFLCKTCEEFELRDKIQKRDRRSMPHVAMRTPSMKRS